MFGQPKTSQVTFGSAAAPSASASSFTFGAAATAAAPAAGAGFSFGAPPSLSGGLFGAKPSAAAPSPAVSGFSSPASTPSAAVSAAPASSGFSFAAAMPTTAFGQTPAPSATSLFGSNASQQPAAAKPGAFSFQPPASTASTASIPPSQPAQPSAFSFPSQQKTAVPQVSQTGASAINPLGMATNAQPSQFGASLQQTPQSQSITGLGGFKLGGASTAASVAATVPPASTTSAGFTLGSNPLAAPAAQKQPTAVTTTSFPGAGFSLAGIGQTSLASTPLTTTVKLAFGLTTLATTSATTGLPTGAASTTFASGLALPTASTAAATATTTATGSLELKTFKYHQLEDRINKWIPELDELEQWFLNQATQVSAWDRVLIENGEKIADLHSDVEQARAEQKRLDRELDFILSQQTELEDMIKPIEDHLNIQKTNSVALNTDMEREQTYKLAESIDGQLKRMTQDVHDIVDHINIVNSSKQVADDPMNQITKILNAHMDSLQYIDHNTALLQRKVEEVGKEMDSRSYDHERSLRMSFH